MYNLKTKYLFLCLVILLLIGMTNIVNSTTIFYIKSKL